MFIKVSTIKTVGAETSVIPEYHMIEVTVEPVSRTTGFRVSVEVLLI